MKEKVGLKNRLPEFFSGGGEMGRLINNYDWSHTPLGSPDKWQLSLRVTVSNLLRSKLPMFLWWGKNMIQFYNDAYRKSLGNEEKHSEALGQNGKDSWPEIYPLLEQVQITGEASCMEDQLVPIYRNGKIEVAYWTYSFSSVLDDEGQHGGILVTCSETTDEVINQKKLQESEQQLLFAIEAAKLGTWDLNPETNRFKSNTRLKEWFGLKPDEEIELPVALAAIADKDREQVMAAIQTSLAFSSGGSYEVVFTVIHPQTGKERIVRAWGKTSFNNKGIAIRLDGTFQDVSVEMEARQLVTETGARLRNLVQQAPVAICVLRGADFIVEVANEKVLEIWGKTSQQMMNRPVFEAMPDAAGQGLEELINDVYKSGTPFIANELAIDLIRKGKQEKVYINFVYEPLYEIDGSISGVVAVATEVTEQVVTRKKVEESERNLIELANAMPQLVWIAEPSGEVVYYNNRVSEFAGAKIHADGNWSWEGLIHPDDINATNDAWLRAVQTGMTYEIEHRTQMLNGQFRWHLSRGIPQRDEEGKIIKWFGTATDIHDQKNAAEKIKESEEQLRTALEGGDLGMYDYNPQTGELIWSNRTKELFGLPPEAEVNYNIFLQGLHPEDRERSHTAIQKTMDPQNGSLYENEYRTIGLMDKKMRWIRSKGKISFDAKGKAVRFTGVAQDITKEKEIIASLQLQSLVLESMDEGVSVSDQNGIILLTNSAEDKMFGYQPGELVGKPVTVQNAYPPEENERIVANVIGELKNKGFWSGEWHNRKKDGTDFYTHSYITSLVLEGKTLFVCVQRDITEEKATSEALAFRTALLEAQNEAIPDAILIVDTKGKMLSFNQNFVELWNIPDEIIKRKDDAADLQYAMTQLADPQSFFDRVNYYYTHPEEKAHEEILFKDGRVIERYGNAVLGEDGRSYGWAWYFSDITERKNSEQAIRQSEERLRTLSEQLELKVKERTAELATLNKTLLVQNETFQQAEESSGQGSYSFNLTTGKLAYSDNLYRLLSFEPGEFAPALEEFYKHVHPEDLDIVKNGAEKVLQIKQADDWKYRMIKKNGEMIHIRGTGRVISLNDEKLLVGTLQDVTKDMLLKQTLQTKNMELERSNEDLQQFAHVASHDLKEPLRKIKTFGNRLTMELGENLSQKGKVYIDKMAAAADRMYAMIDGVLQYSSLDAVHDNINDIDLNDVIRNIESDLEIMIKQTQAKIIYKDLHVIKGSAVLIQQLLYNIINNAIKFSSANREPLVSIQSLIINKKDLIGTISIPDNEKYIQITIADNGIGFSQTYSENIFKTFTRLNSKDKYEGTGLGLALCKKIVERCNGAIYAEGEEGKGARFTIFLPIF